LGACVQYQVATAALPISTCKATATGTVLPPPPRAGPSGQHDVTVGSKNLRAASFQDPYFRHNLPRKVLRGIVPVVKETNVTGAVEDY
jgi:hypothetical protein